MAKKDITEYTNPIHITFFVFINVLYVYLGIRLWKRRVDFAAKVVLVLFYLAFFLEFLSVVSDNTEGYIF
jgi:hypothetical protein